MKKHHLLLVGMSTFALGIAFTAEFSPVSAKAAQYHYADDIVYDNVYTAAYLQADYKPQKLYTTAKGALNKNGKSITLKSIYKKIAIRWDKKYAKQDLLYVRVNGKTYYKLDTNAIQKFNSWKENKTMLSPYAPSSKSKIVIQKGDKVSTATTWRKVVHYKYGTKTIASWHQKNGLWIKN
ncbi:hypothetical protein [Lactiplantibacillus mudanjiangensis]|uniref:Surface layer protein A domain-containing protein n=1 Tax=Lactiplantibacillus mudanjiangensis TaxID=1296538 RepID=A0A660E2D3_9LACO|nr:hypothetical protein [Lactiplantibacillus mudanjiangensis]VDG17605.1 hypothetical protein [Lactobacillus buchneri NRRL B-30929] [Lactiplantibacillus mudanjiangensis]VDG23143.1 hypothetical protein [Lactobacillus buchneri NRRL B-30929] [Lactiplantibacillus mudanjiangensis]VDG29592.1 hypothetical protein [Lactobacillus buchneri NRRL B-30929] [Lactiplantibacillus mudanjiangensis]VDG32706.1 hypothetical protein [Lactobacillus buchneri NRRL B-30929] [Lactiplantibacillus mudanjiangensis]